MLYTFGTWVITNDNHIGIITQVQENTQCYFVSFKDGGKIYNEDEVIEWHGAW